MLGAISIMMIFLIISVIKGLSMHLVGPEDGLGPGRCAIFSLPEILLAVPHRMMKYMVDPIPRFECSGYGGH